MITSNIYKQIFRYKLTHHKMVSIYLQYFLEIMDQPKKPSLFKQRVAALKKQGRDVGFPQVINLIDKKEEKQATPLLAKNEVDQPQVFEVVQEKEEKKGLLDLIKEQAILKEQDMKKIQSENWARIQAMSEEERLKMIDFINKEMKQGFVSRLKKQPNDKQQPPKQPKINPPEKIKEQKEDNSQSWEMLLKVNVEIDQLLYTEENAEHLVNVPRMSQMISSENNQSQIIGSKIASKFVDLLTKEATHKTRELVIISHVPLHLSIIFERCSYQLFLPMLKKARSTSFKSAFIEITAKVAEILTKIRKYLDKATLKELQKPLGLLLEKANSFKLDKENITAIHESLTLLCSLYQKQEDSLQDQDWKNLKENCDFILQLILLEQSQPTFLNTYALRIFNFIDKCTDLDDILKVQSILYELINKLLLRKNQELYIDVEMFRNYWRPVIDAVVARLLSKVNNLELQGIFQMVFLARFAGEASWAHIIGSLEHFTQLKPMIPHFLLFNTLSDQKAGLNQENIESLNAVLNWLAGSLSSIPSKLNPNYLLNTLIELFLQEEQYYSELDQEILLKFITAVTLRHDTNIGPIFSEEKIRSLIKNYSFNSFGNAAFTVLMFLVAVRSSAELEAMILRELIGRYVGNFLSAAKDVKLPLGISQKGQNQDMKSEILQHFDTETHGSNSLVLYLKE